MTALQPPPLQCQYCGADLAKTHHVLTCRVMVDVDTLEIPGFLRQPRKEKDSE